MRPEPRCQAGLQRRALEELQRSRLGLVTERRRCRPSGDGGPAAEAGGSPGYRARGVMGPCHSQQPCKAACVSSSPHCTDGHMEAHRPEVSARDH